VLALGVREPVRPRAPRSLRSPIQRSERARLSRRYRAGVAFGGVRTRARFSEHVLVLRAADAGLALRFAPLALVAMNLAYAATSYPLGRLSDRARRPVAALGVACLLVADLVLAVAAGSPALALLGAALWGLHMGATQGLVTALVADTAPEDLRGTAFGVFHLCVGVAQLVASVLAGALWSWFGPAASFAAGAGFSALALVGLLGAWRPSRGTLR
jgi:MFS family permease